MTNTNIDKHLQTLIKAFITPTQLAHFNSQIISGKIVDLSVIYRIQGYHSLEYSGYFIHYTLQYTYSIQYTPL